MHKSFFTKHSNGAIFLLAPAATYACYKTIFLLVASNDSMLLFWSRSGKLTWSLFSFPLNGRDSLLLFWLALLYSSSPFYLDKNILSPISLPSSLRIKIFEVKILSSFCFPGLKILSPIPIPQKYSKSNSFSDLEKFPLSA